MQGGEVEARREWRCTQDMRIQLWKGFHGHQLHQDRHQSYQTANKKQEHSSNFHRAAISQPLRDQKSALKKRAFAYNAKSTRALHFFCRLGAFRVRVFSFPPKPPAA